MPMTRNQRGFTLVELLIVMVILGVVGAAFVSALTNASKVSQAQAEKSGMQSNLRAGAGLPVNAEVTFVVLPECPSLCFTVSRNILSKRLELCEFHVAIA